jgi:hypothetical protein
VPPTDRTFSTPEPAVAEADCRVLLILSAIGAGGMREPYQARDTRR